MVSVTKSVGATIIREEPFAFVVKEHYRTTRCDNCLRGDELKNLVPCPSCKLFFYCNRKCWLERWESFHGWECPRLTRIPVRPLSHSTRIALLILHKLTKKSGRDVRSQYQTHPKRYRTFADLKSHEADFQQNEEVKEHFSLMLVMLETFCTHPVTGRNDLGYTPAEAFEVYCKLRINGHNIEDECYSTVGLGIYLAGSMLDHSCKPNAAFVFNGLQLRVNAIEEIPDFDISKATICYIEGFKTREERQDELRKRYHFDCECERCQDEEDLLRRESLVCPLERCQKLILMTDPLKRGIKCGHCKKVVCDRLVEAYWKHVTLALRCNVEIDETNGEEMYVQAKACFTLQNGVMPESSVYRLKVMDKAQEAAMGFSKWKSAQKFVKKLLPEARIYFGENSPMIGILSLKYAQLEPQENLNMDSFQLMVSFQSHFLEALRIAAATHGRDSYYYKKILDYIPDVKLRTHIHNHTNG